MCPHKLVLEQVGGIVRARGGWGCGPLIYSLSIVDELYAASGPCVTDTPKARNAPAACDILRATFDLLFGL